MIDPSAPIEADLRSPYPWFGGKRAVASLIWSRFGNVRNFVEPFFGSGAVLLARPQPFVGTETVNDINAWLTNFWRAVQADPRAVAEHADWMVSELDLHARGDWLFYRPDVDGWIERLRSDPDYFDVKSAGWWVWGQGCWIGDGWGRVEKKKRPCVRRKTPDLTEGRGVNRVSRQPPRIGDAGTGVHRQIDSIVAYISGLAERVRRVRVCCGDWSRICSYSPTAKLGLTAIFFDPPYGVADRDTAVYGEDDSTTVSADVRSWCIDHQDDPLLRICLAGYEGEHDMPGWEAVAWKANGGYGNQGDGEQSKANRGRERLWFSPHCLRADHDDMPLSAGQEGSEQ